ncbi:MAG TPA: DNA double-strand break repair nuclease NurA [Ktedonobacterales bacterium]|jgi:hypothetical protein
MLYASKVLAALAEKREHFQGFGADFGKQISGYREALRQLGPRYPTAASISAKLAGRTDAAPAGALPTQEYDRWRALVGDPAGSLIPAMNFREQFEHHQQSRAWAEGIRGITTLAVDGSQLPPWRDASLPVGLIQVGLFENPHDPARPYVKDVLVEVLSPADLAEGENQSQRAPAQGQSSSDQNGAGTESGQSRQAPGRAHHESFAYSEQMVNLRRFELETQALVNWMRRYQERPAEARGAFPLVFYDGSLVVSFALTMPPFYRERYVSAALSLLDASQNCHVPLIGYIDTSYARDVTTLLGRLFDQLPETKHLHDALLWQGALEWGDRTPAFISARGDVLGGYGRFHEQVAFVYMQTVSHRPPARLEFPRWMLEEGILDAALDVVRAEVIIGNGYPYAIEAADAVAVISLRDREEFYRLFQEFAARNDLGLSFSSKALSKSRRRV